DTRNCMPHSRYVFIDLMAWKLSAFAGLCALRHLDLQLVRIDQVLTRDTKPGGCDLLDRAGARVPVRIRNISSGIFAAFARIAAAADAVHGDGQGLMSFLADGPERHRARGKAFDDGFHRFYFVQRNRLGSEFQVHQTAKRAQLLARGIHKRTVFLEDPVIVGARRVLELVDRLRVIDVILAVLPPLVLAAPFQIWLAHRALGKRVAMTRNRLFSHVIEPDPPDTRPRTREIPPHKFLVEPNRLEYCR